MFRFMSYIYRELFARKCTRCIGISLLVRKLLFGLRLCCSKNRWLVANHMLKQWITINTFIRDKSCTCRIEAGISLHKPCVNGASGHPVLLLLYMPKPLAFSRYWNTKSKSTLKIKEKCYHMYRRYICLGQTEMVHLPQFASLYREPSSLCAWLQQSSLT